MQPFEVGQLLGPLGGQLALAFGTGCAAGYAFCFRTVYKLLSAHKDDEHKTCLERIGKLENENTDLRERLKVLEDRWYHGSNRQAAQVRESTYRILGEEKIGKDFEG